MSYEIIYGEGALDPLFDLKSAHAADVLDRIVRCFESNMNQLAADPLQYGKRGGLPMDRPGQQFTFGCKGAPGQRIVFRAHFYFGEDEHSLHVFAVTADPYWRL